MLKRLLTAALLVAGLAAPLATAGTAEARQGCGLGFHRGYYGLCRPNLWRRPFYAPYAYRPVIYRYRPVVYRRFGYYGPRWHRWGYRRFGWHRWGGRHVGFHRFGWRRWGGYRHVGWRGGWHHRR